MDTTNGICQLCGERLTKAGMSRHLSACLPKHDADGRKSQLSRIRIDDETGWFWIDVEMKASDSLATLNAFLRNFWLECCGHLSSFAIGRKEYTTVMWGEPLMQGEYDMAAAKLKNVLSKGTTFYHTYDFGTSTMLRLRVVDERKGGLGDEDVRLLSRNEPPELTCGWCDKPATLICPYEYDWAAPERYACSEHWGKTQCEPEVMMPVLNSPRMGECAYIGPLPESRWYDPGIQAFEQWRDRAEGESDGVGSELTWDSVGDSDGVRVIRMIPGTPRPEE